MAMLFITVAAMWAFGCCCIKMMKKIEPNNKIYPVWARMIIVLYTLISIHHWLG